MRIKSPVWGHKQLLVAPNIKIVSGMDGRKKRVEVVKDIREAHCDNRFRNTQAWRMRNSLSQGLVGTELDEPNSFI